MALVVMARPALIVPGFPGGPDIRKSTAPLKALKGMIRAVVPVLVKPCTPWTVAVLTEMKGGFAPFATAPSAKACSTGRLKGPSPASADEKARPKSKLEYWMSSGVTTPAALVELEPWSAAG